MCDFHLDLMLGVTTNYKLVTEVYDLRTGAVRLKIDNSKHYRPALMSSSFRGSPEAGQAAPGSSSRPPAPASPSPDDRHVLLIGLGSLGLVVIFIVVGVLGRLVWRVCRPG
jgi:hypothetical protein